MIVGMDHGQPVSETFEGRRDQIKGAYQDSPGKNFNPHYAGVVRTAAAFLGEHGVNCAAACKSRCAQSAGISADTCVLNRLVQPNLVKCVSLNVPSMTCRATGTMRTNCCNHLFAEIGLLAPNIIVVHGVKEQWHVLYHMRCHKIEHLDLGDEIGVPRVLYSAPGLECHFVFLWHPSHGMMDRIWETRAIPALTYLKKAGIIPAG